MNEQESTRPHRPAMVNALAVVGFIALIAASMWLAVYSTRFVPGVVGRLGSAAVYLGSVFTPAPAPSLSVVPTPTASTTISFGEANPTISTGASTTPAVVTPTPFKKVTPTAGQKTANTYQISGAATTVRTPTGLPDLTVTIGAVGYLTTCPDSNSFIASSTVPVGNCPAVKFTVKNVGTNMVGAWRFSASIPTQTAYIYESQPQQSLNPGDSIEYTLGFDQATPGTDKMISITANFDHITVESNTNNNSASAKITIIGS